MDVLMNDDEEWDEYQDDMKVRIKRRYQNHSSPEGKVTFITTTNPDQEFIDHDIEMHQNKRDA